MNTTRVLRGRIVQLVEHQWPDPAVFAVAVPAGWRVPLDSLAEVDPQRRLKAAARRIRRVIPSPQVVLALDLTCNELVKFNGKSGGRYWAPHLNILMPRNQQREVRNAFSSLLAPDKRAPLPWHARSVDDPWVATNYALKLSLTAARGRQQLWSGPRGNHPAGYRLQPWTSRLSPDAYEEFLRWRLTFPPEALVETIGHRLGSNSDKARTQMRDCLSFAATSKS